MLRYKQRLGLNYSSRGQNSLCTWENCALCPGELTVLTWLLFIKYPIHDFVSNCNFIACVHFLYLLASPQWRRNCSGRSGNGRYTFPLIFFFFLFFFFFVDINNSHVLKSSSYMRSGPGYILYMYIHVRVQVYTSWYRLATRPSAKTRRAGHAAHAIVLYLVVILCAFAGNVNKAITIYYMFLPIQGRIQEIWKGCGRGCAPSRAKRGSFWGSRS